ncbi:hypothetical protein AB0D65_16300 [Streptomyces griseoloalbus]|uniref:Transposase n=1 Tax=Streptomyces griseoloalbus TaxID=67303 RepID=A0ABV3E5S6_9ACTN
MERSLPPTSPPYARRGSTRRSIAELKGELRKASQQVTELQGKLDALAAVTASLYLEDIELKKKQNTRQQGRLTALTGDTGDTDSHR